MLSSRERMIRALCLEEPDRVPMWALVIDNPIPQAITGKSTALTREAFENDLKVLEETHKKLGLDAMTLYPALYSGQEVKYVNERDYLDMWGAIWRGGPFPTLCGMMHVDGTIKTLEDLEKFHPPDPEDTIEAVKEVERTLRKICGDMLLIPAVCGGFEIGLEMRKGGLANFLSDFYLNPRIPEKIMDMVHKYNMKVLSAMVDFGAEAVLLDEDFADNKGPMISPQLWRKFVKPQIKDFIDRFKRRGVFTLMHICANVTPVLDDLLDMGLDGLHPIEDLNIPQMDIGKIKEEYGDRLCLIGNVDCSEILVSGTEEEVRQAVRTCIEKASSGGGHVLCESNSLHWYVSPKNAVTMYDEGKKYGRYPTRHQPVR